ncbi:MAG: glycosyltransferase family 4 protein [Nitrospirae bacterium]|nr:glycosyltransferase family 4 protein [Nitrospirota bacterium]
MKSKGTQRILFLSHMYPSDMDGAGGIFIHRHVTALRDLGVDVKVISPVPWAPRILWFKDKWRSYGAYPREEELEGVSISRPRYLVLPYMRFRGYSGWSMFVFLYRNIKRLRKRYDFDIIHAHTITPDGHAALMIGKYFAVPVVCTVRGSDLHEYPQRSSRIYTVSKMVLEKADAIITVSNDLAKMATKMATPKNIQVIYNGVDTAKFCRFENREAVKKSLGIPVRSRVIVFAGRCEKEKGIFELLEAFARVEKKTSDIYLLIIGADHTGGAVKNLIEDYGIRDKTLLKGTIPHDEMPVCMNAGDIFVLPSYAEGMANVIYEAMACGLPVVTTNVGGMPEVVSHGSEGFLCQPKNSSELEICITALLDNPALSEEMGLRAIRKVREMFSWETNATKHSNLYKRLLCG